MFLSGMVGTASGGSEKKYKITNNRSGDGIVYPEYAAPGEYVRQKGSGIQPVVTRSSGIPIPTALMSKNTTRAAAGKDQVIYFIMPAENVTIS